jgi:hypothetical protein
MNAQQQRLGETMIKILFAMGAALALPLMTIGVLAVATSSFTTEPAMTVGQAPSGVTSFHLT